MTAKMIRSSPYYSGTAGIVSILVEIAAQLAELNELYRQDMTRANKLLEREQDKNLSVEGSCSEMPQY